MKHNSLRLLPLILTLCAAVLCSSARRTAPDNDNANANKAEYIFLEAAPLLNSNITDYYMLMRHAQHLNPNDPYIAGRVAEIEYYLPTIDSAGTANAYKAMQRRLEASPDEDSYARVVAAAARESNNFDDEINVWQTVINANPDKNDPKMYLADALAMRFRRYRNFDDKNRALALYSSLIHALGPSSNISLKKMNLHLMVGDTLALIAEVDSLRHGAPADANAMLLIGSVYQHINENDSAIAYYNLAEKIDANLGTVYLARADFYAQQGDSAAYDSEVFNALEAQNLEFEQKAQLVTEYVVNLYKDSTQWHRIDSVFTTMQELNPGHPELHELYASYKRTIGHDLDAAKQLNFAIALDAYNERLWNDLLNIYINNQMFEDGLTTAREAMTHFPESPQYAITASMLLTSLNREEESLALLDSIDIAKIPNPLQRSAIYSTRGDLQWKLGMPDSARTSYRAAIKDDKENYMAMNNLAYFNALDNVDLDEAELYIMIATAAEPTNPTYLDTYAWVEFKKKNYTKAREIIDRTLACYQTVQADTTATDNAAEPDQASAEIYDHAGDIYYMTGEPDKALEFWKKAAALEPDNEKIKKKIRHKAYFFE